MALGRVVLAVSARAPAVALAELVFALVGRLVRAVLHGAAMIVAPVPTTSERAVALMALAAVRRQAAMRRSSHGAHRT